MAPKTSKSKTYKQRNPAEQRHWNASGMATYGGRTYDQQMDIEKPGIGNSEERIAEHKAFKVDKAKKTLKKKAKAKRLTQAEVDSRSSAHGGSTAKIPGGDKVDPLTDWEKKYGSKK